MKFNKLFSIDVKHDYFSSGQCSDLLIVPTTECNRLFKNFKLLFKNNRSSHIDVFAETDDNSKTVITVPAGTSFEFYMLLNNTEFVAYSKLPTKQLGEIYFLSSENIDAADKSLVITSVKTSQRTSEGKRLLGIIRVVLKDNKAVSYTIHFRAAEATWKYYCVANSNTKNLTINSEGASIQFAKSNATGNDQQDIISNAIVKTYSNANLVVFESQSSIAFSDGGRKDIQLVNADKNDVLISHLPNPYYYENGIKIINLLNQ